MKWLPIELLMLCVAAGVIVVAVAGSYYGWL
jgi:hypothetical protein